MRRGLSAAINDLRSRREWSQETLANEMCKEAVKLGLALKPTNVQVCRWEQMEFAPCEQARQVLARIAARSKRTQDLAPLFRAPVSAWRLVGYVKLRPVGEPEQAL